MVKMLLRNASLRGRRLKGKGKGVLGARETREAPLAFLSRPKPPFPSLSNACHAGYCDSCYYNEMRFGETRGNNHSHKSF